MKKIILFCTVSVFSLFAPGVLPAQDDDKKIVKRQSMADRKKELAEKKEKQKAEEAAAMAELKQMHYDNQDKKTQKRMKKAMKKANKNNSGKRGFSVRNWFAKKKRY